MHVPAVPVPGAGMKAVALIDGEHYPSVVRDALDELPYEWVGAILVINI